jgi:hypothetical protein
MALIHVMHCREIANLLDSDQVQNLGFVNRQQVRVHLWVCWDCRLLVRQIKWLREVALRMATAAPEPEADFESRILSRLSFPRE